MYLTELYFTLKWLQKQIWNIPYLVYHRRFKKVHIFHRIQLFSHSGCKYQFSNKSGFTLLQFEPENKRNRSEMVKLKKSLFLRKKAQKSV